MLQLVIFATSSNWIFQQASSKWFLEQQRILQRLTNDFASCNKHQVKANAHLLPGIKLLETSLKKYDKDWFILGK